MFRVKVDNAVRAGASAVVVFNEGNPGRRELFSGTLGAPQVGVPALAASFEVGEALRGGRGNGPTGVTVELATDVVAERRRTRNVIAESRAGVPPASSSWGRTSTASRTGPGSTTTAADPPLSSR